MFSSLIRISFRNVTRNFRRSLITATAVLIGTFFIIFARGMLNGLQAAIVAGFTETQAGDIQLHRPEYLEANEALPLDKSFEVNERFHQMMGKVDKLEAYTGRILFSGMISNGEETTLFVGQGMDPEKEYQVAPRNASRVVAGGSALKKEIPNGIVIGKALADALKAKVGSELTLLVNTREGALGGRDVVVVGIADILLPGIGNKIVHLPLETAQQMLHMEKQVTEVIGNVRDLEDVDGVNDQLKEMLAGEYKDLNLIPNTWKDVGQLYLNAIQVQNQVLIYIIAVLFLVMIAGIVNTMLMSVFERVREIGTMMAIGVRRRKILLMFLVESIALGSIGAVLGVGIGGLAVTLTEYTGFPIPSLGTAETPVIYPYIRPGYMLMVCAIALVTAVVAAMYPALRASRLRPADALRTL